MNAELPKLNLRIQELIIHFTDGNVKAFASKLHSFSQQRLDRIFKIDNRTNKYPSVPDELLIDIPQVFPEVNPAWLLTGNGPMLIEGDNQNTVPYKKPTDATVAPLISQFAYAGYMAGFSDPEYLDAQPQFTSSRKQNGGHYVAFEVKGDSMDDGSKRAICDGDILLGRELNKMHWQNRLHVPKVFIIVHKTDGIICKEILKHDVKTGIILCHSWNQDPDYEDFEMNMNDVMQLFYVKEISRQNKY